MKKKLKHKKISLVPKILISVAIAGAVALIVISGIALAHSVNDSMRLSRINQIYSRLDLGDNYIPQFSDVFGDKRPYDWDVSRSFSSIITYAVGKNVDVAVAEVRKAIESEGFTYFEEPYPGSAFTELHFKSSKGEYVRLNVQSKSRQDAFFNANIMKQNTTQALALDPNAGPSTVTIKVNLDDNNE